jgi:hypothetical protein
VFRAVRYLELTWGVVRRHKLYDATPPACEFPWQVSCYVCAAWEQPVATQMCWMSNMNDDLIWKQYESLVGSEKHFNDLQHQYRSLAAKLLFTAFGAMGYALTANNLPIPRELLVAFLSLIATIGVTMLWALDIRVYHQLLEACFVEALTLERTHSWLPQVRTKMLKTQRTDKLRNRKGVLSTVVRFYMYGFGLSFTACGIAVFLFIHPRDESLSLWVAGGMAVIAIAWLVILSRGTTSRLLEEYIDSV